MSKKGRGVNLYRQALDECDLVLRFRRSEHFGLCDVDKCDGRYFYAFWLGMEWYDSGSVGSLGRAGSWGSS